MHLRDVTCSSACLGITERLLSLWVQELPQVLYDPFEHPEVIVYSNQLCRPMTRDEP